MSELKIGSSLNFTTVGELLNDDVVAKASDTLLLDLSATEQVDSAGVALLLHWLRLCQARDIEFSLLGVSQQLQALFDAYELNGVLN